MSNPDAVRQVAVAAALGGGFLAGVSGDYGCTARSRSPVLPANYSFAIWAPIYVGVLSYAVYQALPVRQQDPVLRRTGWAAAAAVGLSGTWVWVQDAPALQFPLIAATAVAAGRAYLQAAPADEKERASVGGQWLVRAPLGLFTGWITLASVAATSEILITLGVKAPWPGPEVWSAAALTGVAGATAAVVWRRPVSWSSPLAVAWGLAGVAARALPSQRLPGMTAALGAAAVTLAGWRGSRRKR